MLSSLVKSVNIECSDEDDKTDTESRWTCEFDEYIHHSARCTCSSYFTRAHLILTVINDT